MAYNETPTRKDPLMNEKLRRTGQWIKEHSVEIGGATLITAYVALNIFAYKVTVEEQQKQQEKSAAAQQDYLDLYADAQAFRRQQHQI